MKNTYVALLLFISSSACAQYNLVPNPSFEQYDTCPTNGGQLQYVLHWINPIPIWSSPDYMNACATTNLCSVPHNVLGNEVPHSGNAYSFIVIGTHSIATPSANNYREYLETELNDSLKSGTEYCVRFYVSLADSIQYSCNNIGVYFAPSYITDTCHWCNLSYTPQVENPDSNDLSNKNGWTEITGSFVAHGGEKYIVIGNFRDTLSTTVSFVGGGAMAWYEYAGYYIDDVLVSPCDSLSGMNDPKVNPETNVFPNPSNGIYTIEAQKIPDQVTVYDLLGNLIICTQNVKDKKSIIDLSNEANGIYILSIRMHEVQYNYKLIKQ